MKKLTLLLTAIILTFSIPAHAEQDGEPNTTQATTPAAPSTGDVQVHVNGLVCDFCARALEKVFGKEEAVNNIDVNLDTKIITITFNQKQSLSDERITTLITDSGYNVQDIQHVQ